MKRIIILGPPLSGKGTQGQLLAERLNLPRLSVGALIRKLFKDKKPIGIQASKYMLEGEGIPGEMLIRIIDPWLKRHASGFVVDNLIRTEDQLKSFTQYCKSDNFKIDQVIYLTLPRREIYKRFTLRIIEHAKNKKTREDETKEKLEARIKVNQETINKILNYFLKNSNVSRVSANHSVKKVHEDILDILKVSFNGDH